MNYDWNIDKYTKQELIEIFELPLDYDENDVDIKIKKILNKTLKSNKIDENTKQQTIEFLAKSKKILNKYDLKEININEENEHVIQIKKPTPYILSYPSDFFPGVINPLKKRTIVKNLNIDTKFRDNYYTSSPSNFNIILPFNLDNVLQMELNAIELPQFIYSITKSYGNNYFYIEVNGVEEIIIIPDGNYNNKTIKNIINTILTNYGVPLSYISLDIDNITNKARFLSNGSGIVSSLVLDFKNNNDDYDDNKNNNKILQLKLGWLLGFRYAVYSGGIEYSSEGLVNMTGGLVDASGCLLDISGQRYFYLIVDDYNNNVNNNFIASFNSSILNNNIIARISLTSRKCNILLENNTEIVTSPREYLGPVNLRSLKIQLLDEYGRIVDLNNMDYSFCLSLVVAYDL